jgi:hypothetical protein
VEFGSDINFLLVLEIKLVVKYKVVLMKVMEWLFKWTKRECGIG